MPRQAAPQSSDRKTRRTEHRRKRQTAAGLVGPREVERGIHGSRSFRPIYAEQDKTETARDGAAALVAGSVKAALRRGVDVLLDGGVFDTGMLMKRAVMALHRLHACGRHEEKRKRDQDSQHCVQPCEPAVVGDHVSGSGPLISRSVD
jgi:hypothetical protein